MRGNKFIIMGDGDQHQETIKKVMLGIIFLIVPIGIPFIPLYRPNYVFHLTDYSLMVLLTFFATTSFLFSMEFLNFFRNELVPQVKEKQELLEWSRWFFLLFIGINAFFFGVAAAINWQRYIQHPAAFESTPIHDPQYGSAFSFGPYAWVLFITFAALGIANSLPMIIFLLIFKLFLKGEQVVSKVRLKIWEEWVSIFGIIFIWLSIFILPFSTEMSTPVAVTYVIILVVYLIFYLLGRWEIQKLDYQYPLPTNIDELQEDKLRTYRYSQKQRAIKFATLLGMAVTVIFITTQYFDKIENIFNNIFFFTIIVLSVIGVTLVDFLTVDFYEPTVSEEFLLRKEILFVAKDKAVQNEEEEKKEIALDEGLTQEEIQEVLRVNLSHIFVLKNLVRNETPMSINDLMKGFPNTKSNLRSALNKMLELNYCVKMKNPEDMRVKLYDITDKGYQVYETFLKITGMLQEIEESFD